MRFPGNSKCAADDRNKKDQMEPDRTKLFDILIACLGKEKNASDAAALSSLSAADWQELITLAATQRIAPLFWHRLTQQGFHKMAPADTAGQFHMMFRQNTIRNMRLNGELHLFLSKLNAEKIPLIALKGIVLANTVYPSVGLREMNDIDVLARPEDIPKIIRILTGMGYKPMKDAGLTLVMQTSHHLPGFMKKGHAQIELHWNITQPNRPYTIDPEGLWERAVRVRIAGSDALTLCAEDLLLHLCLHTSYQHPFTFGLRPFCDIAATIDHVGGALNWQTVVNRAHDQKWQKGVYLALRLSWEMAGAAVPDIVMKNLQPAKTPDTVLEAARSQIVTDKYFAGSVPLPFARLLESSSWREKITIFRQRVFVSKAVMAKSYSVPVNSFRIYIFYLRRLYDIIRRHSRTFKNFQKSDTGVKSLAGRKKLIADWMDIND